jgi:hypothetical protein
MFHGRAETKFWHVAIEHFELIRFDQIGFMPNSDTSISANGLIELLPRFQMRLGWLAGKPF